MMAWWWICHKPISSLIVAKIIGTRLHHQISMTLFWRSESSLNFLDVLLEFNLKSWHLSGWCWITNVAGFSLLWTDALIFLSFYLPWLHGTLDDSITEVSGVEEFIWGHIFSCRVPSANWNDSASTHTQHVIVLKFTVYSRISWIYSIRSIL